METLIAIGLAAGFIAGFFGVGGGAVTVPLLLAAGLEIKYAIGVSSMQMVFSSVFGSLLNYQKGSLDVKAILPLGLGALGGGVMGGFLLDAVAARTVELIFFALLLFALGRVFFSPAEPTKPEIHNQPLYFVLGLGIATVAGMLGVGGAVMLIPVLVGFMHYGIKKAVAAGLFFVVFSSSTAFATIYTLGYVDLQTGLAVALSSLFGVKAGIWAGGKTGVKRHKALVALMYVVLITLTSYEIFIQG